MNLKIVVITEMLKCPICKRNMREFLPAQTKKTKTYYCSNIKCSNIEHTEIEIVSKNVPYSSNI